MYITLEADYAIRIVAHLTKINTKVDAKTLASVVNVSDRFTLKILSKLVKSGIAKSYKGASGGYELALPAGEISLKDIITVIDGPIVVNRCICDEYQCDRNGDKTACAIHNIFGKVSEKVDNELSKYTFDKIVKIKKENKKEN
ncbi:MAG: Rrf2 family transcriptional regulator [Clostridia bacterium]|nr:Rrf2 family transcriptional regulator [Clostridia bacterium]